MVVLVVLVFVAGFGNRQEVNYKLIIVNTINCNILFHSVVFFFFALFYWLHTNNSLESFGCGFLLLIM